MPQKALPVIFLAFANSHYEEEHLPFLIKEKNNIRQALHSVNKRICEVIIESDITFDRIVEVFQENKNNVVIFHYAGHADIENWHLKDERGETKKAYSEGFVSFLAQQEGLNLVFLNGCLTKNQAKRLRNRGIPVVIGTSRSISDETASKISRKFYEGLGKGISLKKSWSAAIDFIKTEKGERKLRIIDAFYEEEKKEIKPAPIQISAILPHTMRKGKFLKKFRSKTTDLFDRRVRKGNSRIIDSFYEKNEENDSIEGSWQILYDESSNIFADSWDLPSISNSPLFGLPLPRRYYFNFPESPYLGFEPYEESEASIYWGRGREIWELFSKICDIYPVILLHGENFVGKTSLVRAGLIPRISDQIVTNYTLCNRETSLVEALNDGLTGLFEKGSTLPISVNLDGPKIETDKKLPEGTTKFYHNPDDKPPNGWDPMDQDPKINRELSVDDSHRNYWQHVESLCIRNFATNESKKDELAPMVLFMDQVGCHLERSELLENHKDPSPDFFSVLGEIFSKSLKATKGKLVLVVRENHKEAFSTALDLADIPYTTFHLKPFDWQGIVETIRGIQSNPYAKNFYKCELEERFPEFISDLLMLDNDLERIDHTFKEVEAPFLQLLLNKIWENQKQVLQSVPFLSKKSYASIGGSIWPNDYLKKCLREDEDELGRELKELISSGLVYDLLHQISIAQEINNKFSYDQIETLYPHCYNQIKSLLTILIKRKVLLEDKRGESCRLLNNVLKPSIHYFYDTSNRPGQVAARTLQKSEPFSRKDLENILEGESGMRSLKREEQNRVDQASKEFIPEIVLGLIRDNQVERAIKILLYFFKREIISNSSLENDVILLSANWHWLKRNTYKSLLSPEKQFGEVKRISVELIQVCNEIKDDISDSMNFWELEKRIFHSLARDELEDVINLLKYLPINEKSKIHQILDSINILLQEINDQSEKGIIQSEVKMIGRNRIRYCLIKFAQKVNFSIDSHPHPKVFEAILQPIFENLNFQFQEAIKEQNLLEFILKLNIISLKINEIELGSRLSILHSRQKDFLKDRRRGANEESLLRSFNNLILELLRMYPQVFNNKFWVEENAKSNLENTKNSLEKFLEKGGVQESLEIISELVDQIGDEDLKLNLLLLKSGFHKFSNDLMRGELELYSNKNQNLLHENIIRNELTNVFNLLKQKILNSNLDVEANLEMSEKAHTTQVLKLIEQGEIEIAIKYAQYFLNWNQEDLDRIRALDFQLNSINLKILGGEFGFLTEPYEINRIIHSLYYFIKEYYFSFNEEDARVLLEKEYWEKLLEKISMNKLKEVFSDLLNCLGEERYYFSEGDFFLISSRLNLLEKNQSLGLLKEEEYHSAENQIRVSLIQKITLSMENEDI